MVETLTLGGRYRVENRLAAGGMGTVYRATDGRLGREVAVKMLREEYTADPRFIERFRREARAAASLSHPNIAGVFDYGEDEGRHFIVMELVTGRDLAHVIRDEGALDPERVVYLGGQICDALAHAHDGGLVHRDIKPANVIVDDNDHVKVTDFGIARAVGDSTLTATGTMLGTAHYLSPEQANGAPATAASDQYALGVVLFEMLTGEPPFTGDSPVVVAMRHTAESVPQPSTIAPNIPAHLDDAVERATARDPAERFPDARALKGALRGHAVLGPPTTEVLGAPTGTEELSAGATKTAAFDARRFGRAALVGLGVLALIATGLLALRLLTGPEQEAQERQRPRGGAGVPARTPSPRTPSPTPTLFRINDSIIGMNVKDVEDALEELGFIVETEKVEDDAPKDTVVETDPPVGAVVAPGDTIILFVSEGPDEDHGRGNGKGRGRGGDDD